MSSVNVACLAHNQNILPATLPRIFAEFSGSYPSDSSPSFFLRHPILKSLSSKAKHSTRQWIIVGILASCGSPSSAQGGLHISSRSGRQTHMREIKANALPDRFSGLSAAHYLRKYTQIQSFVIYEKSAKTRGGAGTWKDNTVRPFRPH